MTWFRAALLAILLILPATAAAPAADEVPIDFTVRADLSGDTLSVHGKATVPDGAFVIYAVYRKAPPLSRVRGYARVKDHRYAAKVDVAGWPSGEISVDAHFQTMLPERTQPAAVTDLFGEKGQRMTGHQVVQEGLGYRAAVASTSVVKP